MEKILFLAHTEADGTLGKSALEALNAALSLGGPVTVGLSGAATQAGADQIAGCGADRFLAVTGEPFAAPRCRWWASGSASASSSRA